jgi:hypothetical protein
MPSSPSIFEKRIDITCNPFEDAACSSRMLRHYVKLLSKRKKPEILDLGPVCGSNVSFFVNYSAKLHIHDLLLERPGVSYKSPCIMLPLIQALEFRRNSLDGIHIWDLHDHLDNKELSSVLFELSSLLKPEGLLVMISSNSSGQQPFPQYFRIKEDLTVTLQKTRSLRLPYHYRTNRDIEKAMRPFEQISSYICTNGVREFLFRKRKESAH